MLDPLKLHGTARHVVQQAIDLANQEGQERTGGYLCVMHRATGQVVLHTLIGKGPADDKKLWRQKVAKWRKLSLEKARRLRQNIPGHTTSYESQDEDKDQYPGAILGSEYIFSLSGLKALDDEAAMWRTAIALGQCDRASVLAHISDERNPRLRIFLNQIHWTE